MFIVWQIPDPIATQTASDIVCYALGIGAQTFAGVLDNTDVFFNVARAGLGMWR